MEAVTLARDGLRSHRYHIMQRYCAICAPLRMVGGLLGASRFFVGLCAVAATAFVLLQR